MKTAYTVIFLSLSVCCRGQGLHCKYLFQKSLRTDTFFSETSTVLYGRDSVTEKIFTGDNVSLYLLFQNHLLYRYKFSYRNKIENEFDILYDSLQRISAIATSKPIIDTIVFDYDDSSVFFSTVTSSKVGEMGFDFDSSGLITEVSLKGNQIDVEYDAEGNVSAVGGRYKKWHALRDFLRRLNNFYRMSLDYQHMDTSHLLKIDRLMYRDNKIATTALWGVTDTESVRKIYTNTDIPSNLFYYPSCPDCNMKKPHLLPPKFEYGIYLGFSQPQTTYFARGTLGLRVYVNDGCYQKILFSRYVEMICSASLNNESLTYYGPVSPVTFSSDQRLFLYQTSFLRPELKYNLITGVSRRNMYEFNGGLGFDLASVHLSQTNGTLTAATNSFFLEEKVELLRTHALKMSVFVREVSQNYFPSNNAVSSFHDQYIVPGINVRFLRRGIGSIKISYTQMENHNSFFLCDIGLANFL